MKYISDKLLEYLKPAKRKAPSADNSNADNATCSYNYLYNTSTEQTVLPNTSPNTFEGFSEGDFGAGAGSNWSDSGVDSCADSGGDGGGGSD